MVRGQVIVGRDTPPASSIGTEEPHVYTRRELHRRQRAKGGDVPRGIVEESFLRRDNLVERLLEERLIAPSRAALVVAKEDHNCDQEYESHGPRGDVSRGEK